MNVPHKPKLTDYLTEALAKSLTEEGRQSLLEERKLLEAEAQREQREALQIQARPLDAPEVGEGFSRVSVRLIRLAAAVVEDRGRRVAASMAASNARRGRVPPVRRPHDLDNRQRPIPPPRRVLGAGRVQDQRVSELRRAGEDRPRYKPSSACDPRRTRRRVSAPDCW